MISLFAHREFVDYMNKIYVSSQAHTRGGGQVVIRQVSLGVVHYHPRNGAPLLINQQVDYRNQVWVRVLSR